MNNTAPGWSRAVAVEPFAMTLCTSVNAQEDEVAEARRLEAQVGELSERGHYPQASASEGRAFAILERLRSAAHPDTATSLNNLALLYTAAGAYAKGGVALSARGRDRRECAQLQ